jgi:hypothetical protein
MCIVFDYQYDACLHVEASGVLAKCYTYRTSRQCDGDEMKNIKRKGFCPACAEEITKKQQDEKESREAEKAEWVWQSCY